MASLIVSLGNLLIFLLDIYSFIIIASVIVSWLIAFDVLSMGHPKTRRLLSILGRLTDPVFKPVQRVIPGIGGIDISPIIIIFGLMFFKNMVFSVMIKPFYV